jgi:TPR repeat protein
MRRLAFRLLQRRKWLDTNQIMTKLLAFLLRVLVITACLPLANALANPLTILTSKMSTAMPDLPRNEKLPLFDPHRKTFACVYQTQHLPPIDPQAELWFQQALALDDPDVYYKNRDYPKIYQLYLQAAERNHWKAMLNLASLIVSNSPGVPEHDPEVAIRWVEKAMQLGIPDAYDVMGTYHQNGMIKGGDATSAYAFFQRAADMGSPAAMTYLGYKMAATYDDPAEGFWGNLPVATQMLECAFAQGYGDAAAKLGLIYARPGTAEAKLRALKVMHEGVKLGSAECANSLSSEYRGLGLTDGTNLVGHIDKARAQRYSKIGDMLGLYQGRLKLPNLDKVLPPPPAPLPRWDGDTQTLIDGAKAVTQQPKPQQGAVLQGREFVPAGHSVPSLKQSSLVVTGDQLVPRDGYWLALYGPTSAPKDQLMNARGTSPEMYQAGERFEPSAFSWLGVDQVQWHYLGEAFLAPPQREDFLRHMVEAGLLREIAKPESVLQCNGSQSCTKTGIWEARVAADHPLATLYNRWDQQAFVEKGQDFPHPRDRFMGIGHDELRWTYQGSPNADLGTPGVREITL